MIEPLYGEIDFALLPLHGIEIADFRHAPDRRGAYGGRMRGPDRLPVVFDA